MSRLVKLTLILIFPVLLFGGETGKIVGKVVDQSTGEPLVGVDVYIEGTELGAATGSDGGYVINFVPAGTYEVTASYIGYEPVKKIGVVVLADQTFYLDFRLKPTVYKVEKPIISIAERPIVVISQTGTERHITSEEFDEMPVQTISDVIALQSGVVTDALGFAHVRGGREDEVIHFVDGMSIRDPIRGIHPTVNAGAVEEVSVITGGFDPEYGEALSGVVNIVTKEGGSKHSGFLRYTTDDIFPKENSLNFGHNLYEVAVGGPLVSQDLRYFVSGELRFDEDFSPHHYRVYQPQDIYKVNGRFTYRLPGKRGKLSASGFYTRRQVSDFYIEWKFLPEGYVARRYHDFLGSGALSIMFGKNTRLYLKAGYYSHDYMRTPRDPAKEEEVWGDRKDFWEDYQFLAEDAVLSGAKRFESLKGTDEWIDSMRTLIIDSVMAHWVQRDYTSVPNPYGIQSAFPYTALGGYNSLRFWTSGYTRLFRYEFSSRLMGKGDLTHNIGRVHEIKAGFSAYKHRVGRYYNSIPWSPNPFWDVYDFEPIEAAGYIQDKLEFEGLIVRGGFRIDYFDPAAQKRKHPENLLSDTLVDSEVKYRISPRFAFSFPITDRSKLRFNYGQFFQTPSMRYLYESLITEVAMRGNQIVGNPDLAAKKTTAYEIGYENAFTEDFGINFTAFYKDIYDLEGTREIFALPVSYTLLTAVEYGNVKGFEVALTKRLSNYWRSRISYALQYAKGTASNAWEAYRLIINAPPDPITGEHPPYLKIDYPLDFDQRHTFHLDFGISFPHEFAIMPLKDFDLGWILTYSSGMPYTPLTQKGELAGDKHSAYMPGSWNVDLKVSKGIKLGLPMLTLTCQVYNLFNSEKWLNVWPSSGLPYDDGSEITPGQFTGGYTLFDLPTYHPSNDANHDGYTTNTEYYQAFVRARDDIMNNPWDYGPPRIIRLGAEISF